MGTDMRYVTAYGSKFLQAGGLYEGHRFLMSKTVQKLPDKGIIGRWSSLAEMSHVTASRPSTQSQVQRRLKKGVGQNDRPLPPNICVYTSVFKSCCFV
eukprot:scaffold32260_cov18-Tisochrysis_lutea.AAC.1